MRLIDDKNTSKDYDLEGKGRRDALLASQAEAFKFLNEIVNRVKTRKPIEEIETLCRQTQTRVQAMGNIGLATL
jgi:hypothetical protein